MDTIDFINVSEWDERSQRSGLFTVFTTRWSEEQCDAVNSVQQQMLFELLPNLSDKTVLDLGCGIGRLIAPLSTRCRSVVGLDISRGMLNKARNNSPLHVSFVQASSDNLPFSTAQFDVVIASYVLPHIVDNMVFARTVREIARVLKGDGQALFVDLLGSTFQRFSELTVRRTKDQYFTLLQSTCSLVEERPMTCVEDQYTIMSWRRYKDFGLYR